jgi:hypothetical protein
MENYHITGEQSTSKRPSPRNHVLFAGEAKTVPVPEVVRPEKGELPTVNQLGFYVWPTARSGEV